MRVPNHQPETLGHLAAELDRVVVGHLPASLKAQVDRLLAAGEPPAKIAAVAEKVIRRAGGAPLTLRAVRAYLGLEG